MGLLEPDERRRGPHGRSHLNEPARPPAVVVHDLVQALAAARAAEAAGRRLLLISAEGAASSLGAAGWRALVEAVRRVLPEAPVVFLLDCADEAGRAQEALAQGIALIRFDGQAEALRRLAALAETQGAHVLTERPAALDLARSRDPEAEVAAWLGLGNPQSTSSR